MTDEWIKVTAKSGRRRHTRPPTSSSSSPSTSLKTSDSPDPDSTPSCRTTGPFLSVDEIARQHKSLQTQWETSTSREALIALLDKQFAATSDAPVTIQDAICLGAGTFDPADGSWQAKRSAHLQVLAFETIVSHLESLLDKKIIRITQEPVLTPNDETFLKTHLSHTILPSPEAFHAITPNTLLYGIHLYRPIYAAALEKSLPGIFVGTDADVWDTVSMEKKHDTSRLQQIHNIYNRVTFPEEKGGTVFLNTTIYFRKADSTSSDDTKNESTKDNSTKEDDKGRDTTTQREPKDAPTPEKQGNHTTLHTQDNKKEDFTTQDGGKGEASKTATIDDRKI
ncbi:hypothetical protein VHEMI05425 [[Torrubiella] hemipterigena]|uniref:SRR1-like domain-containing protein n=1 Tax=[Torrubiella] hemipterigena TaxID=1531966 RepID=A0A0A1TGM0_9HYPO|nr:hypothetical protein VHEMI05425 [[Torrubiella] hemipterigena]